MSTDHDVDLGLSENQEVGSFNGSMHGQDPNHHNIDLALEDRSNSNSSMAFRNAMGSLIMSGQTGQNVSVSRVTTSKIDGESPNEVSFDNMGQSQNDRSQNNGRVNSVSDTDKDKTIDLTSGVNVIQEENESEFERSLNASAHHSAKSSNQALSLQGSQTNLSKRSKTNPPLA